MIFISPKEDARKVIMKTIMTEDVESTEGKTKCS